MSDKLKRQVAAWVAEALAKVEPYEIAEVASAMQGLVRIEGHVEIQRESPLVHRVRVRTAQQGVRYFYVKVSEQM